MKRNALVALLVIIFVLLIGGFLFTQHLATPQNDEGTLPGVKQYSNGTYGLAFAYPSHYLLSETDVPGSEMRKHHEITLMRREDLPLPEAGESPPSITIDIYQNNLDKQSAEQWIRNASASNFKLGEGVLATTTIGGLPALSFRWSGLYEGTTIALATENWVYAFTVTYLEMGAPIVQDFVAIRDSVRISN